MTQFEANLVGMQANLEVEQKQFEEERWAKTCATELAEYRRVQEATCNEGIAALQKQRDQAVAKREEQLRAELKADVERRFGVARTKLEELRALFSANAENG